MRDDLLHAQASVNWAVSQLPSFSQKLGNWLRDNIDASVKETEPPATHNVIVAVEKSPLPLEFSAETGAYINTIRSSLDILATALAHRHHVTRPDSVYFPVARSEAAFLAGNYKGHEFVSALPTRDRRIIEDLKPYKGGNRTLWYLHELDIMRKHRSLIGVQVSPFHLSLTGDGNIHEDFEPIRNETGWIRANQETILGLIRKDAPDYEVKFTPSIMLGEPDLGAGQPVIIALERFANHCRWIISLFDTP